MTRFVTSIVKSILWLFGLYKYKKINLIWFHINNHEGVSGWSGWNRNKAHNKNYWRGK
jgi:hypothetical protein